MKTKEEIEAKRDEMVVKTWNALNREGADIVCDTLNWVLGIEPDERIEFIANEATFHPRYS